jgi:pilus assembly protein Flp/PilA
LIPKGALIAHRPCTPALGTAADLSKRSSIHQHSEVHHVPYRSTIWPFPAVFCRDDEGAQVVEYALIIAVVSIALVVALKALTSSGGGFSSFITRVTNCLTTSTCS